LLDRKTILLLKIEAGRQQQVDVAHFQEELELIEAALADWLRRNTDADRRSGRSCLPADPLDELRDDPDDGSWRRGLGRGNAAPGTDELSRRDVDGAALDPAATDVDPDRDPSRHRRSPRPRSSSR